MTLTKDCERRSFELILMKGDPVSEETKNDLEAIGLNMRFTYIDNKQKSKFDIQPPILEVMEYFPNKRRPHTYTGKKEIYQFIEEIKNIGKMRKV